VILLLSAFLSVPAWTQESEEPAVPADTDSEVTVADEPEAPEEPAPEPEPEFDETGLDEQGFADEDDDFDPSETIPTDQSIEFPTDI
jgi:hypothetical protein